MINGWSRIRTAVGVVILLGTVAGAVIAHETRYLKVGDEPLAVRPRH